MKANFLFLIFFCVSLNVFAQNDITFIVSNPFEIKTNFGTGIDIKTLKRLDLNSINKTDTIKVFVNKYRKVYLRNDFVFKSIICKKHDTVFVDILKDSIKTHFLNKRLKMYDTLSLSKVFKLNLKKEVDKVENFKKKFLKKTQDVANTTKRNFDIETYKKYCALEKELSLHKKSFLEKLFNEGLINKSNYKYNISQINYGEFILLIKAFKDTGVDFFKHKVLDDYFRTDFILNDDFIAYGYINRLIKDVVLKGKRIQINPSIKYDYKKAFDSLPLFLSDSLLKYAQFLCLKEISNNSRYKEFETYSTKYMNTIGNKDMFKKVEKLKNEHAGNPFLLRVDSKKVKLISKKEEIFKFNEVLEKNFGKVIYIDFWASWCKPCRKLMPLSKILQNEYKREPIVFVYFSIDKDIEKWKIAAKEEGLNDYPNNYLAMNYPIATFYKKLKLNSIPRYLLINKKGELVFNDAPSPNNEKIREVISELLKE